VVAQAKAAGLISREHFSVDGTLIEAWASLKSFKKKGASKKDEPPPDDPGNPSVDFHGEKRSNETHESTTDPDAKLARKGAGQGSEAVVFRARAHREPQRAAGGVPDGRGGWPG
jgi:hypothetical protein